MFIDMAVIKYKQNILQCRCGWQERPGCMSSCVQMYSGLHGRAIIFTETKKECNELVVFEELQRQKPQVSCLFKVKKKI